jgi:DNA-binding NtrC family response regulator
MAEILMVEDDPRQRAEFAGAFVHARHRVEVASGGNEALARQNKRFDLLLTDFMMDQGTGFDVLSWVWENAPGLPVVSWSSYAKGENLEAFLTTRFYRIVRKPFQIEHLVDQIRELLAALD